MQNKKWIQMFVNAYLKTFIFFPLLFIILSAAALLEASENSVDNSIYAELLKRYVKEGLVDYNGFKKEESHLDKYLKVLENTNSKTLSKNEQFAFYVNAYNAWTIKLILTVYPEVKSIKDLGTLFQSPWKKKICKIDKELLSLDDIEHKILRPKFKDPRVHFAVNCASKGCPVLASEPYLGNTLDKQLDIAAQKFINNTERNYIKDNTLYVSSIFKWFSEDFDNDIVGFIAKYASDKLKSELDSKTNNIKIKYLDYDWSLNKV